MIKIKYMGSKSRVAKYIVPIIQKCIDENNITTYIEPFAGGLNVIDKIRCKHRYAYDINKYLIALWLHLQNDGKLLDNVPRELYNEVRANYQSGCYEDWYVGNIGFLASYNGRWFDGGYAQPGYEKNKSGMRYRDYYREASNNILNQLANVEDIELKTEDYRNIQPSGAVVYCDPPYQGVKKYANSVDFNYEEFWDIMRKWSENNYVFVSELDAPDDFRCIWMQEVSRSIKATDKSRAVEKLFITNTEQESMSEGEI